MNTNNFLIFLVLVYEGQESNALFQMIWKLENIFINYNYREVAFMASWESFWVYISLIV